MELFRPVLNIAGMLVATLGATMLLPMLVDLVDGSPDWEAFFLSAALSVGIGGATAFATRGERGGLSIQQVFLLTTGVWTLLPVFGALPMIFGTDPGHHISVTDALFESVSGLTTTGSTALSELEYRPRGLLLWRSMLQWFGGIGIIVVAVAFLPAMKVGGMQFFRSEAFDTFGKVLPRAAEISGAIFRIYVLLTVLCLLAYEALGMPFFDALCHALTTISTGGFSTWDASFGVYQGAPEYVASVFMILASLPFIRFVQLSAGATTPLLRDPQVRAFIGLIAGLVVVLTVYRITVNGDHLEHSIREALFNVTSILSGTGYASVDYQLWGPLPVTIFFLVGLIGGCAGSTCCSVKIFRFQILAAAIRARIARLHSPSGVFVARYDGRAISEELFSSVAAFFMAFVVTLGTVTAILLLIGLDPVTALSGAATAVANIGPGLGDTIGPAGNFESLPDSAKWVLTVAMLLGRLELLSVFVLFTPAFWQK